MLSVNIEDRLADILEESKKRIQANMASNGINASGITSDSLRVEKKENGATLYGKRYFSVIETGRRGGRVPKGFYTIIKEWSINKGLSFGSETERSRFAYFVSKKIAESGTKLFRDGGRDDIYTPEIKKAIEEARKIISVEITSILKDNKK